MSTMPVARTWTDDEVVTAAMMNTYLRDAMLSTPARLDSTSFTSSQASVTFSGYSTAYAHLLLIGGFASDTNAIASPCLIQFNGDTATNYDFATQYSTGSAVASGDSLTSSGIGGVVASAKLAVQESLGITVISNYNSSFYKSAITTTFAVTSTAGGAMFNMHKGGTWKSTAAITSIRVVPTSGGLGHGNLTLYGLP